MNMKKQSIIPGLGETVKLRGREPFGVLFKIGGPQNKWCQVSWQSTTHGPIIVHLDELERIGIPRYEFSEGEQIPDCITRDH